MGVVLLTLTLVRIVLPFVCQGEIPRIQPHNNKHRIFINITHIALYFSIGLLVAIGLIMIANYAIPITLLGMTFEGKKENFYQFFPKVYDVHMFLQTSIWWLITIHFFGVLYAKK
jgi:cytochrome b561